MSLRRLRLLDHLRRRPLALIAGGRYRAGIGRGDRLAGRATGDEEIAGNRSGPTTLREGLLRDYSITQPTPKFLKMIAQRASAAPLMNELLEPERKQDLETYLWGLEVIDFLVEHPSINLEPQEFVALLPKLQPRLYSIASSLKAFPSAVHFIVDVVKYRSHGRTRKGVCSTFLADRCSDSPAPIFPTASIPSRASSWSPRIGGRRGG